MGQYSKFHKLQVEDLGTEGTVAAYYSFSVVSNREQWVVIDFIAF